MFLSVAIIVLGLVVLGVLYVVLRRPVESITLERIADEPSVTGRTFTLAFETPLRAGVEGALARASELVDTSTLEPLEPSLRAHLESEWVAAESLYARSPAEGLREAQRLVGEVIKIRGVKGVSFQEAAIGFGQVIGEIHAVRAANRAMTHVVDGNAPGQDQRLAMEITRKVFSRVLGSTDDYVSATREGPARG